jgi:RNA polymerase-binding transcription factor DksA
MVTTIQISDSLKTKLDKLKIYHRETYNELLLRILENCIVEDSEQENMEATIEILSDSETMKNIKDALQRIKSGDYGTSIEKVRKELGLD